MTGQILMLLLSGSGILLFGGSLLASVINSRAQRPPISQEAFDAVSKDADALAEYMRTADTSKFRTLAEFRNEVRRKALGEDHGG